LSSRATPAQIPVRNNTTLVTNTIKIKGLTKCSVDNLKHNARYTTTPWSGLTASYTEPKINFTAGNTYGIIEKKETAVSVERETNTSG